MEVLHALAGRVAGAELPDEEGLRIHRHLVAAVPKVGQARGRVCVCVCKGVCANACANGCACVLVPGEEELHIHSHLWRLCRGWGGGRGVGGSV